MKEKTDQFITFDTRPDEVSTWKIENEGYLYVLRLKGKKYLVERTGKCNPKKCHSACCKFIHLGKRSYFGGFCCKSKFGYIIKKKCKYLKNNKCTLWKKKSFPNVCKQFPHPSDGVFLEISKKCSFKFEIVMKEYLTKQK